MEENCCQEMDTEMTSNNHPVIGRNVPDMPLTMLRDGEEKTGKLSDYEGKWLILFFYPADFTFVCPTELEQMAELYPKFKEADAEVLSVSTDTVFAHKAWKDQSTAVGKVSFPMVADPTGNLCREFGVYIDEKGLALRGSFVIDPNGVLQAYEVHADGIGRNAEELLRKLQAAQFVREHGDQVCPAKWAPGSTTLKPGMDLVGKI